MKHSWILSVEQSFSALQALPSARGRFASRVTWGKASTGVPLDAVDGPRLDRWLAAEIGGIPRADAKLAAACLTRSLAWALADPLGGLALVGTAITALPAGAIRLTERRVGYETDSVSKSMPVYDTAFDVSRIEFSDKTPDGADVSRVLCEHLAPLLAGISQRAGLGRAALWRVAGDALAAALLGYGKALSDEDRAMRLALSILRQPGSPLTSRQAGFFRLDLPEAPHIGEWFRARGGCCRVYTTEGGEYCSTCVLRDKASRDRKLCAFLRRKHGLGAA